METAETGVLEDEFGAKDYRPQMDLKADHGSRPLWVVSMCGFSYFLCFLFGITILLNI